MAAGAKKKMMNVHSAAYAQNMYVHSTSILFGTFAHALGRGLHTREQTNIHICMYVIIIARPPHARARAGTETETEKECWSRNYYVGSRRSVHFLFRVSMSLPMFACVLRVDRMVFGWTRKFHPFTIDTCAQVSARTPASARGVILCHIYL